MFNIIKALNGYYRYYLRHKWVNYVLTIFFVLLFLFNLILHHWFNAILVVLALWAWKYLFTFPEKGKNSYNAVGFIGVPGSGKSSMLALLNAKAQAKNSCVFANIPLKGTYVFDYRNDYGIYDISDTVVIIDEIALESGLNNRDFKKNFGGKDTFVADDPKLRTLKLHRHYRQQIYWASQSPDCEKKLLDLTTMIYLLQPTGFHWLLKVQPVGVRVGIDDETKDFRFERYKKRLPYFIFSPVIWLTFDTEDAPVLPYKEFKFRG